LGGGGGLPPFGVRRRVPPPLFQLQDRFSLFGLLGCHAACFSFVLWVPPLRGPSHALTKGTQHANRQPCQSEVDKMVLE
jgi:hypothetical protein